jgi:class 3 adenylate cyclase
LQRFAEVSDGIVSSLFPSLFRDQITCSRLRDLRPTNGATTHSSVGTDGFPPIAGFFPETTVLFADIAGFTQWSSGRRPDDVFGLLEAIFRAFDNVARRLQVYKVETIGDCYVAVTGLPDPQPQHAVIMVEFSLQCLEKITALKQRLCNCFGTETQELGIRFGMHSGPVTAGVLRGTRARFQLFGDTVYTASIVENAGVPDRIHVSSETARHLVAAGKESWLIPRVDLTTVPDGKVNTYFILGNEKEDSASIVVDFEQEQQHSSGL